MGALTGSLSFMWTAEGGTIYVPTLPGLSHATSSRVTRSGDLVLGATRCR